MPSAHGATASQGSRPRVIGPLRLTRPAASPRALKPSARGAAASQRERPRAIAPLKASHLSLIHISEPTRLALI
eukprot:14126257-Alexandrium_andersonii.AAC.1